MNDNSTISTLETGRQLLSSMNPGMETTLEQRYGQYLPGMAQSVVDFAYGQQYARPAVPMRERCIATIAALTALGAQTAPQLKINIIGGLNTGLCKVEIAEIIWQMSLYGGFPAAINALNVALEAFAEYDELEGLAHP